MKTLRDDRRTWRLVERRGDNQQKIFLDNRHDLGVDRKAAQKKGLGILPKGVQI